MREAGGSHHDRDERARRTSDEEKISRTMNAEKTRSRQETVFNSILLS
jgi:hypothetical protein